MSVDFRTVTLPRTIPQGVERVIVLPSLEQVRELDLAKTPVTRMDFYNALVNVIGSIAHPFLEDGSISHADFSTPEIDLLQKDTSLLQGVIERTDVIDLSSRDALLPFWGRL